MLKRFLIAAAIAAAMMTVARGQGILNPVTGIPYSFMPLTPGQHGLTVASSTALTLPIGSAYATVCVSGQPVKYTTDGTTTPTSSVGQPLAVGQCVFLQGKQVLTNFRAIQTTSTATLDVEYFQ